MATICKGEAFATAKQTLESANIRTETTCAIITDGGTKSNGGMGDKTPSIVSSNSSTSRIDREQDDSQSLPSVTESSSSNSNSYSDGKFENLFSPSLGKDLRLLNAQLASNGKHFALEESRRSSRNGAKEGDEEAPNCSDAIPKTNHNPSKGFVVSPTTCSGNVAPTHVFDNDEVVTPHNAPSRSRRARQMHTTTLPTTITPHETAVITTTPLQKNKSSEPLFSEIVHRLVIETDKTHPELICWIADGEAFMVPGAKNPAIASVLQQYFKHNKYSSLQRQLNMYGWKKHTVGKYRGAFHHPLFHRKLESCSLESISRNMSRTQLKSIMPRTKRFHSESISKASNDDKGTVSIPLKKRKVQSKNKGNPRKLGLRAKSGRTPSSSSSVSSKKLYKAKTKRLLKPPSTAANKQRNQSSSLLVIDDHSIADVPHSSLKPYGAAEITNELDDTLLRCSETLFGELGIDVSQDAGLSGGTIEERRNDIQSPRISHPTFPGPIPPTPVVSTSAHFSERRNGLQVTVKRSTQMLVSPLFVPNQSTRGIPNHPGQAIAEDMPSPVGNFTRNSSSTFFLPFVGMVGDLQNALDLGGEVPPQTCPPLLINQSKREEMLSDQGGKESLLD